VPEDDVTAFDGRPDEEPPGYEDPQLGWLPLSGLQQSCATCSASVVMWLHPLSTEAARFRYLGKEYTLPTYWTLCDRCEHLYEQGADAELTDLIQREAQPSQPGDEAFFRQMIQTFGAADLGVRRLDDSAATNE
jgi:hypothetical protein